MAINEASYLKGGVLCDQVCLGISAPVEEWAGVTPPPEHGLPARERSAGAEKAHDGA